MKRLLAIFCVLSFVAVIAASSAVADDFVTGCIKQKGNGDPKKNTKLKRVAKGTEPGSPCKNNEVEVTMPTDQVTDDLQAQIDLLDGRVEALEMQINDPGGIAEMVQMNKDAISTLQDQVSSLIGGDIGTGAVLSNGTEFAGMFGSQSVGDAFEDNVTQNMAAPGIITNLFVRSETMLENNTLDVTIRKNKIDTFLTCTVPSEGSECNVTGCVDFDQGDLISVELSHTQGGVAQGVDDVRWNSRFVENGVCL